MVRDTSVKKQITLFDDLSEQIHYNLPELPIYARIDRLSMYADYRCPCHWHRDLEFIHAMSGELHYFVNGRVIVLHAGQGLVVNSSRLHYGFSPDRQEAWFSCAVISPLLFEQLTADVHTRCERAFAQDMDDFLTFSPDVDWQRDILESMERTIRLMPNNGATASQHNDAEHTANPLPAVAAAINLCDAVINRFQPASNELTNDLGGEQRNRIAVLEMTGLVQRRFREQLRLDDIAAAGNMSRSQCCLLFKRYVGRTPNEYLTERRLEEAKRLLRDTAGSVAQIARACGFSSSSYFVSVFRRRFAQTPRTYRESL